jgi:REP element-mobilizing transposase RayT
MSNKLRIHNKDFIYFITSKTQHDLFLLKPSKEINNLILYWLARAKVVAGKNIELYSFVFLSNHFHMILKDPQGELPAFLGYFKSHLAIAVNRSLGRKGTFWKNVYSDQIMVGDEEFLKMFTYTTLNAVKSGLVQKASLWPGVGACDYIMEQKPVTGTHYNVTNYNAAVRFGKKADKKDFMETYSFELAELPHIKGNNDKQKRDFLLHLFESGKDEYEKKREKKGYLGVKKIMKQSPFDSPKEIAKKKNFKFISFNPEQKKELEEMYQLFTNSYKSCLKYIDTLFDKIMLPELKIPWPKGSYPPGMHKAIGLI